MTNREIENDLKILNKNTGHYRKLTQEQIEEFISLQAKFAPYFYHFRDRKYSIKFWNKMLVLNYIPKDCVIIAWDYSGNVLLGEKTKNKSVSRHFNKSNTYDYVLPLGISFAYRGKNGETEFFHRLCIPDTVSLTSFEAIYITEELLRNTDGELRDILQNAKRFIVTKVT